MISNNGAGQISVVDFILLEKEGKVAHPLAAESYINKSYTFNSQAELYSIIEEAKKTNLDQLYTIVKESWKKFIDADNFHISICAADTIFNLFAR